MFDIWFLFGLFLFFVFGWFDEISDLVEFYLTFFFEIGYDILFFWVVCMVMMGMKLIGKVLFK